MLIGRENSWLINARTSHKQHFVGTRQVVGLTGKAQSAESWKRLETFALRYASPGSVVRVYCLHSEDGRPRLASEFEKKSHVPFQAPGCSKRGDNGVILPPFIQLPIERSSLDSSGLIGWNEAQLDILNILGAERRPTSPQADDEEMLSEELAVEETQIAQSSLDCTHV